MSDKAVTILAKPHPLRSDVFTCVLPVGGTIAEMVGENVDEAIEVSISGEFIPRDMWDRIKPKDGTAILVVRYPKGDTAKKIVGIVLLLVIAYYAPYLLDIYGAWGAVAVAGLTMLATMAIYAMMPPPELPKVAGATDFNRLNSITGTSNQNTPYGSIPMVIGECRYYPPFAAMPYSEILGDDQYLRMLLDLGYGTDLSVSDIKIGETPLLDFDDVEYQIGVNPSLFSNDIFELSLADGFNPGAIVNKTTQTNTDEISVDVVFSGGLFGVNKKGKTTVATTSFKLEYQPLAGGTWINVGSLADVTISSSIASIVSGNVQVSSSARKALRIGVRWKVAQGQYNIRATRYATTFGVDTDESARFDSATLATLRSIKYLAPSNTGTQKLALKIKATDQLNGVINQLSLVVQQKIKVYDPVSLTWSAPIVSFNPAWIYYWLLNDCPGVAQKVEAARIDLPAFVEFADLCTASGFTCKGIIDRAIASGDLYKLILSSGRGAFAMRDGKYSVLVDKANQAPIQHFSPANTRDFSGQRVFIDLPEALRVRFQNPELNWQEDEIIVLRDGFSYNGTGPRGEVSANPGASKFETLTLPYVTSPQAAWQIARYHIAQAVYRPNVYTFNTDIEHLVCTRGDLVYAVNDVTEWGSGFGLVSGVIRSTGGNVTSIITAEPLLIEAGQTYSIRVRGINGNSNTSAISPLTAGYHTTFPLVTPLSAVVDVGDLYLIGKTTSAIAQLLITRIQPGKDFQAELMAVEYRAEVQTYDDNPPTLFISSISGTQILEPPPPPVIYAIFSDPKKIDNPDGGGGFDPGIIGGISPGPSGYVLPRRPEWRTNIQ